MIEPIHKNRDLFMFFKKEPISNAIHKKSSNQIKRAVFEKLKNLMDSTIKMFKKSSGKRTTAWKVEDIKALIEKHSNQ